MDLESFAMEAEAAHAVVLLALHGGWGENGYIQSLLQDHKVPYTGPQWDGASLTNSKVPSPPSLRAPCSL
jgi:D-alanine-D-alanine ligase-like ATP-grasp enzyme